MALGIERAEAPDTPDFGAIIGQTNGQAGIVAPTTPLTTPTAGTVAANRAYWQRFVPLAAYQVTTIGFVVASASASNVDVGIYSANLTKIVSSGSTSGKTGATGRQTVTVAATDLTAYTIYYAAFACDSATPQFLQVGFSNAYQLWGSAVPEYECVVKDASFALPAGTVTGTSPVATGPVLTLS